MTLLIKQSNALSASCVVSGMSLEGNGNHLKIPKLAISVFMESQLQYRNLCFQTADSHFLLFAVCAPVASTDVAVTCVSRGWDEAFPNPQTCVYPV